ncbi:MAG: GDSL-type esterase/lipase family protein [Pseudomonadota bacterium]
MSEPMERGLALGLSGLAALVGLACASRARLEASSNPPLAAVAALPAPQAARVASAASLAAPAPPTAASPSPSPTAADPTELNLTHFYADLAGLEQRQRKTPVRIFWLGDSHTAADYLTGAVRARLQARFGAGGPGFMRVGVKPYRHTQVRWSFDGPWKIEPPQPSRRTPFDDGVFTLGGMRAMPNGAPAQAGFELSPGTAHGQVHWQVWFALGEAGGFRVSLAGMTQVLSKTSAAPELPGAHFAVLSLNGAISDRLELVTLSGAPRFFGVLAEGSEPGLVLDAVGIDGARVATALAWNEASFEAAVRARAPSLAVFAFGTNEAFDAEKIENYRAQYQALLGRVRRAAPDADCLLVGPPDANAVSGGSEPRVAQIDALQRAVAGELGCGYVSQLEIMGGPGGYTRWANKTPSLARGDRLHLSVKGYEQMANSIADRLLAAYGRKVPDKH